MRNLVLGCFCHPQPCHGHVYQSWHEKGGPYLIGEDLFFVDEALPPVENWVGLKERHRAETARRAMMGPGETVPE